MAQLYSDYLRLCYFCYDDRPPSIDLSDLFRATPLCEPFGLKLSSELKKKFNLNPFEPIERVCDALINHTNALSALKASGDAGAPTRHHNVVPMSTINFLTWEMLVRCNNSDILPPKALLKLVRLQLGVRSQQISEEEDELAMKREDACRFSFNHPNTSFRDIAKRYGVNVSTVSRWNDQYNLRERGKMIQQMCDQIDRQVEALNAEIRKESEKNKN